MEPFATAAELAAFIGRPSFAAGTELAQARLVLDDASAAVRDFCGQTITYVADDEVTLPGIWEPVLELPERPIVAVTAVTLDDLELVVDVDFTVVPTGLRRGPAGEPCPGGYWGGPTSSVTVVYSHGFTIDDDAFKTARGVTLAAAARTLANPTGVIQESVGSYSVTYGARAGAVDLTKTEKARLRRRGLCARPLTTITRSPLAS